MTDDIAPVVRASEVSYHTQLAKVAFDKILVLPADVFFVVVNCMYFFHFIHFFPSNLFSSPFFFSLPPSRNSDPG